MNRPDAKSARLLIVLLMAAPPYAMADQQIGEACDVFSPCREGAQCIPTPWIGPFQQRCVAEDGNPLDEVACMAFYSESVHDFVKSDLADTEYQARTYGGGAEIALIASASAEIGTAYGIDGRYGCYTSTCEGSGFVSLGLTTFGTWGDWRSWDSLPGTSSYYWFGGGAGITFVEGAVYAWPLNLSEPADGYLYTASLGLSVDAGVGTATCETTLLTLVSPDDIYVDLDATGGANGSSLAPFHSFDEAYAVSTQLSEMIPRITIRATSGSSGTIAAGVYDTPLVITSDQNPADGPITLTGD